jgi:hypothetical protein
MGLKDLPYHLATLTSFYLFSVLGLLFIAVTTHLLEFYDEGILQWIPYWAMTILFLASSCNYSALWSLMIRGPEDVISALTNLGIFLMSFLYVMISNQLGQSWHC